jgi:hypothetical protein
MDKAGLVERVAEGSLRGDHLNDHVFGVRRERDFAVIGDGDWVPL